MKKQIGGLQLKKYKDRQTEKKMKQEPTMRGLNGRVGNENKGMKNKLGNHYFLVFYIFRNV